MFTIVGEYILIVRPPPFGRLALACIDVAEDRDLPWAKQIIEPYDDGKVYPQLFSYTGLIFALIGMWLFLWLRRGRRARTSDRVRHQTGEESESEATATPSQVASYSNSEWVVGIFIILVSTSITGLALSLLGRIMRERRAMTLMSDGKPAENVWGVGQIGALFAWAPLLVDLVYDAAHECRTCAGARSPSPMSQHYLSTV
jgi:hypothetical protein